VIVRTVPVVRVVLVVGIAGGLMLAAGCHRERAAALAAVPLPDLSAADPVVQKQVRDRHAALTRLLEQSAGAGPLAVAFGEMGMLLHAGEYHDAAEPAYRNAEALSPSDPRWPYYLARLHARKGRADQAIAAYQRSLRLRPEVGTLIWLGRLYLDQGQPEQAAPLFEQAGAQAPRAVAAIAGLGQAALARRDFGEAARLLEEALLVDPGASSIHAPLAQAYRGLGVTTKAAGHLARWRNTDIPVPDPWDEQLRTALAGGMSYESRGVIAFEAGRFAEAAELFQAGLAVTPHASPVGRSLRHKLGLALHLAGDEAAAVHEFEEAVRLAPSAGLDEQAAKAHYALGVIDAGHSRGHPAIEHLFKAVAYDPRYVQARVVLGDALIQVARYDEALAQHREASATDPRSVAARIGYAQALLGLRRNREARAWLEESVRVLPDRPELRQVLAQLNASLRKQPP
jgi:tetratricopeptide (TPR) repeat protein